VEKDREAVYFVSSITSINEVYFDGVFFKSLSIPNVVLHDDSDSIKHGHFSITIRKEALHILMQTTSVELNDALYNTGSLRKGLVFSVVNRSNCLLNDGLQTIISALPNF